MAANLPQSHQYLEYLHIFGLEDTLLFKLFDRAPTALINPIVKLSLLLAHLQDLNARCSVGKFDNRLALVVSGLLRPP